MDEILCFKGQRQWENNLCSLGKLIGHSHVMVAINYFLIIKFVWIKY